MNSKIIWLASYPKSGNTMVSAFLASYFFTNTGKLDNLNILKNISSFNNYGNFSQLNNFPNMDFFFKKTRGD